MKSSVALTFLSIYLFIKFKVCYTDNEYVGLDIGIVSVHLENRCSEPLYVKSVNLISFEINCGSGKTPKYIPDEINTIQR